MVKLFLLFLLCILSLNASPQERVTIQQLNTASADSIHQQAVKARLSKDFKRSIQLDLKAEKMYGKSAVKPFLSFRSSGLGPCLANLGECYLLTGNNDKAIIYFQKLIETSKSDKFGLWVSQKYNELIGTAYFNKNDYYNSIKALMEAVQALRTIYPDGSSPKENELLGDAVSILMELYNGYAKSGNFNINAALSKEILSIASEAGDRKTVNQYTLGLAMCNLGKAFNAYTATGDTVGLKKSIEFDNYCLNALPDSATFSIRSAISCFKSISYSLLGEKDKALDCVQKADSLMKSGVNPLSKGYVANLRDIGVAYAMMERYDDALLYADKVYNLYQNRQGEDTQNSFETLKYIAHLYSEKGNIKKALEYAYKALKACSQLGGETNPEYNNTIRMLADYLDWNGYSAKAFGWVKILLVRERNELSSGFSETGQTARTHMWQNMKSDFLNLLPLIASHVMSDSVVCMAYDYSALFAKGVLLESEKSVGEIIRESNDSVADKLFNDLTKVKAQLTRAIESKDSADINHLTLQMYHQEEALSQRVSRLGDITKRLNTTWEDVQRCLNDSDIAVEFLDCETDTGTLYLALTLCKGDKAPQLHKICYENRIDSLFDVWKPLVQRLEGKRNIFFSPIGHLYRIPIENFADLDTFNVYRLSSTRELVYRNSASVVAVPCASHKSMSQPKNAILFGDLDNNKPLTYSKEEVDEIDSILISHGISCTVFTGKSGTKKRFYEMSGNAPCILHLATHGYYWSMPKARKYKQVNLSRLLDFSLDIPEEDVALTRSGIFLSDNLTGDSLFKGSDGIITAREIANMNLQGLDLVVLSACNTGRGDINDGEGVFGLQRAFKKAGAKSILMTLWKVDDHATQILMSKFYEYLHSGESKLKALRHAQSYLCKYADGIYSQWKYWAAFILLDALD